MLFHLWRAEALRYKQTANNYYRSLKASSTHHGKLKLSATPLWKAKAFRYIFKAWRVKALRYIALID